MRLEASDLAGRSRLLGACTAADNPAHRRIARQTLGVVHVFIPGETSEYRLAQKADVHVARVLAPTAIPQHATGERGETERIVQFAICEQPRIGCDT